MASIMATSTEEELRKQREEEERLEKERLAAEQAALNSAQPVQTPSAPSQSVQDIMDEANRQGFQRTVQEHAKGVDVDVVKAGKFASLPENLEEERPALDKANREGRMTQGTTWDVQNKIKVDFDSIESDDQAFFFATTLSTDKDKLNFIDEYAHKTGQNPWAVLSKAEERLGNKLFAEPKSQGAKIRTYNQGLANQNLLDVNGNALDLNTASQPQIEQAIRMHPDNKAAISYYEKLCAARGWTYDKESLAFMDSADLTLKEYNAEKSKYNTLFTFGYSDDNRDAYLDELANILNDYSSPRVQKQLEFALKGAYEDHTRRAAPTRDEIQAVIEQDALDTEDLTFWQNWKENGFKQAVTDLFSNKEEVEAKPEEEPAKGEEPVQEAEKGESILDGGTMSVGDQEVNVSKPIASTTMPPKSELYPASSYGAAGSAPAVEQDSGAMAASGYAAAGDVSKASVAGGKPAEVQGPAQKKIYERVVPYDPNMTDEQALAEYMGGGTLDPRNKAQIEWLTDDAGTRGVLTGLNPSDLRWNVGLTSEARYDGSQFWQYGPTIAKAIDVVHSGVLPDDMSLSATLAIGKAVKTLRSELANPANGIAVPAGQHALEYMLSLPEYQGVANSIKAVHDAQKDVVRINAENEIEAKLAHQQLVEEYKAAIAAGNGTEEMLAVVAAEYDDGEYVNFNDDETYQMFTNQLSYRSTYFHDDNGAFWQGDSAAAIEGRNLKTLGSGYLDFKTVLKSETEKVLQNYTIAAKGMGMTLEEYLGSAGIDSVDQVIDIAYNGMQATGHAFAKDTEAQEAVQTIAENPQSIGLGGAISAGTEKAVKERTANLMQTTYMALDKADYDRQVKELRVEYYNKYRDEAPRMYYSDLMALVESGQLSKESSAELLRNMQETDDIFEIGYKIEDGFLETLLRAPAEELTKDVEALSDIIANLPQNERWVANAFNMGVDTLYGIGLVAVGTAVTGSPLAGATIGYGLPSVDPKYHELRGKDFTSGTAWKMALAYGGATALANMGGAKGQMEMWGDMARTTMHKAFMNDGYIGLAKSALKLAGKRGVEEAIDEVKDTGVDILFDISEDAVAAYDRGENPKLSKAFALTLERFNNTDVVQLGKDLLINGGVGFAMGGLFALAGTPMNAYIASKGAKMDKSYGSISMARKIVDGEMELNEETVGQVYAQVYKDIQDPKFRRWIDSANSIARDQNNMITAAMTGVGSESRKAAVIEANKAKDYEEKADAAKHAWYRSTANWLELQKQVADGDLSAVPKMTNAQQRMAKDKTAQIEAETAAEKARTAAAERTREWMAACGTFKSQAMGYFSTRALINRAALAQQVVRMRDYEQIVAAREADLVIEGMTDEEIDAEIGSMEELDARAATAEAESAEMGYDAETLEALSEQKNENGMPERRAAIIRNQRNQYKSLSDRMQTAQELEDPDAYAQLEEERNAVEGRLTRLGEAPVDPQAEANAAREARIDRAEDITTGTTKVEREAVAAIEREQRNLDAMDVEAFIESKFPNASDEQKQKIREVYQKKLDARKATQSPESTPEEKLGNGVQMLMRMKNKYGFNIKVVDKIGDRGEGGYVRDSNTIYVTRDVTQSEALNRVLLHEMTHASEGGKGDYRKMRNALLKMRYHGNKAQEDADVASIVRDYNEFYKKQGITDKKTGAIKQMSREEALQELTAKINSEVLSGNAEMIERLASESPSVARSIMEKIKNFINRLRGVDSAETAQMRRVVAMFDKALKKAQTIQRKFSADGIQYSLREKDPPKNVVYAYKAFYARDGKLYPPMVANITDEADKQKVKGATSGTMKSLPTPVGVWLDADIGGIMTDETGKPVRSKDTKRLRVKNDKSGGGATLAFRPGWHLGEWPDAKQFNKADPETGERGKRMPDDLVFAKCEVSADVDYQLDALSYGLNEKGSFSRSQAGLPYIPDDGYYKYRTNVDPTTAPWLIAGSIKVVEILDDEDCARICAEFGVTPDQRYSGKPIDLSKYGLKRGPVEEATEGMEPFKENDANRANKKLLEDALNDPEYAGAYVRREIDFDNPKQYEQLQKEFAMNGQDIEEYRELYETRGFASEHRAGVPVAQDDAGETLVGDIDGSAVQYSLRSWTDKEKETVRSKLFEAGFDPTDIDAWIDDVNSISRIIAADKERLDFEADDDQVMLKKNDEYVRTLDASTLCAKRLLYQGTFNAIQHLMPNHVFTSEELLDILNMMKEAGYDSPCGVCYVESRRRHLGKFADQFLHGRPAAKGQKAWEPYSGDYIPTLDELTTTDGLKKLKAEHPKAYEAFIKRMNSLGSGNPKVVQLRTDYRGDIRKLRESQIAEILRIGGLRVQSFSDFETPHLLDMMQAVLDMAAKNLTSQAYTKVPNFAWVFGDTGIKINLSLLAEGSGVDENGNLIFSSSEGMDFDEAMRLRDRYSKNVGTIIVGANDAHIRAAMADPRIDYIIPFHKSGWGENELRKVGVLQTYTNYEDYQNERVITGYYKNGNPIYGKPEGGNFYPIDYWDYNKSGDENAATYLRMCEEDGRVPKFDQFLTNDEDGHWVAPSGYWKMLIDFKMYDNDGVGAPQEAVRPMFNTEEAVRVLGEYEGGANELPVAQDIVDRVVSELSGMQFALKYNDDPYSTPKDRSRSSKEYVQPWINLNGFDDAISQDEFFEMKGNINNAPKKYKTMKVLQAGRPVAVSVFSGTKPKLIILEPEDYEYYVADVYELDADGYGKSTYDLIKKFERAARRYDRQGLYSWAGRIGKAYGHGVFRRIDRAVSGGFGVDTEKGPAREVYPALGGNGQGRLDGRRGNEDYREHGGVNLEDTKLSIAPLPSDEILEREIESWINARQSDIEAAASNDGVSRFATDTVQRAVSVPVEVKREFATNPLLRSYAKDTNAEQLERAMNNIDRDGYEAEVNRLLNADYFSAEDNVEAATIAISAFEAGDISTGLEMALKYRMAGTDMAQAMQSRKLFATMSPTHLKLKIAGEMEQKLADFIKGHSPKAAEINKRAKAADDEISGFLGGDELERIVSQRDFEISSSKWGVPINEKQKRLIDFYKLNNVSRPGVYYNRATLKQRMLEAILCTPDPDADSGNGLTLTQRLEWMQEGEAVVTQADLNYIADQIRLYSQMPDSDQAARAGDLALARAYEAYGNINPASKMDKARTWRYVSMLLSLPSAERNLIGNAAQNLVNAATHDTLGVFTDWVTSLFTGKRTTAALSIKERAEGWQAWAEETANTFLDYFVERADATPSEQGDTKFNANKRGRVYQTKGFEDMRLVQGFLMSVGDRNFWKKSFVNSIAEQQRVADMNGVELDYEAAAEIAKAEANYATFNEDGFVRNWLAQARRDPAVGFVLDMVMPFTGVPTNITKRMVEYSPLGMGITAIKALYRAATGANFDQKAFVNGISRGLSGTALWMIGMGLAELGAIRLGTSEEDDEKVYNLRAAMGEQYSPYIRVGNEYVSLSAFAPSVSPLIMGATAYDILNGDEDSMQAFANALTASLDQIFDASYMSGLSDLFDQNGTPAENALNALVTNAISQNVPAFMNQIATAMDPYVRDTKDKNAIMQAVKNGLINRIPGVRQQFLNPKYDTSGRAVESKEGIRNFIDPFTTTNANDDPILAELDRLYDETGSSSHIPTYLVKTSGKVQILAKIADARGVNIDRKKGEQNIVLTASERNYYNQMYSQFVFEGTGKQKYKGFGNIETSFEGIRDIVNSREYKRADDEGKAEMLAEVLKKAKLLTQAQMVIDKGYTK